MARGKTHWGDWSDGWQDRVASTDEPLDAACPDVEQIVGDAIAMAQTVIECTVEPLRDLLAELPSALDFQNWGRRGRWRRRARRGA
jgi:hypothetical protein